MCVCTYIYFYIYWYGDLTFENRCHRYAACAGCDEYTCMNIYIYTYITYIYIYVYILTCIYLLAWRADH